MKTSLLNSSSDSVEKAAELLKAGEIVGVPTETVYGLAGNAFDPSVVKKIFQAKERPSFDPLIVHFPQFFLYAEGGWMKALVDQGILSETVMSWPHREQIEKTIEQFWPGPLTCILPKGDAIPPEVTSGQETVGIRCPAHPLFQELLDSVDFPLAAPSANRFGRVSPTAAEHVMNELSGRIAAVLDGGSCSVGVESSIIRIEDGPFQVTLLRPGKISEAQLGSAFGVKIVHHRTLGEENQKQLAPGMLDEHYAPTKPLYLYPGDFADPAKVKTFASRHGDAEMGTYLAMSVLPKELQKNTSTALSPSGDIEEIARRLFSTLRELDGDPGVHFLVVEALTDSSSGLAKAVLDRLNRASRNKPFKT